jgi:hypothetical protein
MTLLINFLTAYCWAMAVYYATLKAIVVFVHLKHDKAEVHIEEPLATIGPMAICFLIAKYCM